MPRFDKNPLKEERETLGEILANSITHGLGAILSVAGLAVMVVLSSLYGDARTIVCASIYGSTLVLLYFSSTLYHSIQNKKAKRVLRIIDHSSIYLLIAGTYTPFLLVGLRGAIGWTMFGIIWALALAGIFYKAFFIKHHPKTQVGIFIAMGWISVFLVKEIFIKISLGAVILLGAGGLLYTFGIVFYVRNKMLYNHAIWHVFVLGGTMCHFFSVLLYVLPKG
ncbi:hemolysin III family protein [PVC group bacterium]|nr:hemolysin III family protein [PVC group bacterium]